MKNGYSIGLIMPCYNEEEGLKIMLPKIPELIDEVIIVDNNSTDETANIAKSYGCTVIQEKKQGYGAAYKRGFRYNNNDIAVTMDADDTYPLEEIEKNLMYLIHTESDFLNCSRFPLKNEESMYLTNKIGNKILTLESQLLFGYDLLDSQSGMVIFKKEIFDFIFPKSDEMALCQELKLLALMNDNIKFNESHINYKARIGEVKLNKWRDGLDNMCQMLKMRFSN